MREFAIILGGAMLLWLASAVEVKAQSVSRVALEQAKHKE